MKALNVAVLQMDLVWEDHDANRAQAEQMLGQVSGADLVVLPEMFSTGFTMNPGRLPVFEIQQATLAWMQAMAAQHQTTLMGSMVADFADGYANTLYVVNGDGIVASYSKRHLFRMAGEHEAYIGGRDRVIFELKGWRICPMVCYDLRFPVFARNKHLGGGQLDYDLLVYVANWPEPRVTHWSTLLLARAIENQAYVIGCNRVGEDENGFKFNGESAIVDHMGKRMQFLQGKTGVLQQQLDPAPMLRYREKFPVWQDADRFRLED